MKKAVIIARVSTLEQEDGHSLDGQIQRLREYCQRKTLNIIKEYRIVESSTRGRRKLFNEALGFASSRGETIAIVVDKVDRLQRRVSEVASLEPLINTNKIELHFCSENSIIHSGSRANDKTMWNMQAVFAQNYTDMVSDNVCKTIDHKTKMGELCWPAPLGYLNFDNHETGKKDVMLDPERSFLVRRIFDEYATGNYSMGAIVQMAKEWGLRSKKKNVLGKSSIESILKNPFYYGYMRTKGEIKKHCYPPLIDYSLFQTCESVIARHNKKPFKYAGLPFIFRGLVRCAKCGRAYTSEKKKGKYVYLRPNPKDGCDCKPINQTMVLEDVGKTLKKLKIPAHVMEDIRKQLKANFEAKKKHHNTYIDSLRKEQIDIEKNLDKLLDLLIASSITKEVYDKKSSSMQKRQVEVENEMQTLTRADHIFSETLSSLLDIASRAYELFESSDPDEKRKIINFIFPNLEIRNKKVEKTMRKPLGYMLGMGLNEKWLRGQDSNL